ncbi:hypothetical protein BSKO_13698 [Bryopsis sp. KO-2023]|nr:hypothetical protein BSKO_13698 [Bryopsis sp. KO-2023]
MAESPVVVAIVPVLNEADSIGAVVSGLLDRGLSSVTVVDNGSADASAELARRAGAHVVHEGKRGYGAACWTGLLSLPDSCDFVLFCAGDGQEDLSEVPKLIEATRSASLVVGDRLGTSGGYLTLTATQRWASWIGGVVMWMGWGYYFTDIGGMRVISRKAITAMDLQDRGYGFFVEMQVKAVSLNLPIAQIPINYKPRMRGVSKISGTIKGTLKAAFILVTTVIRLYLFDIWQILTSPSPTLRKLNNRSHSSPPSEPPPNSERAPPTDVEMAAPSNLLMPVSENRRLSDSVIRVHEGKKQQYPGYPVLASHDASVSDGEKDDGGHWLSPPEEKNPVVDLPHEEDREWKRVADLRLRLWAILAAVCVIYGTVLTSVYNDPKEQGGPVLFSLGVGVIGVGFFMMQAMPAMGSRWLWVVACLSRLAGLMASSSPGDDIYRFVWEGWIQRRGFNPYALNPTSPVLRPAREKSHYIGLVFMRINHPETTSVYPPLAQLFFRLISILAMRAEFFRLFFVAADLMSCWLLSRRFGNKRAALYAWNPLVILSSATGGHYDPWMVLPLILAWFTCERGRWALSAFLLGVSIGFKWVTAPFLPFLIVAFCEWRGWLGVLFKRFGANQAPTAPSSKIRGWELFSFSMKVSICIGVLGLSPLVLSAIPFCDRVFCQLAPLDSKWAAYTRVSDFLPRVLYYLIPSSGKLDNKAFAVPVIIFLAFMYWREAGQPRHQRLLRFAEFGELYFFLLLVFAPIVHFWYFTWGLPFVCQTNNLGTRVMSVSAFASLFRYSRGASASLTVWEWAAMWGPYLVGWAIYRSGNSQWLSRLSGRVLPKFANSNREKERGV